MSTITAPPPSRRNSRRGSRRPARVLLDTEAVVGIHESNTAARGRTRNGEPIQVSFRLKRPPQPSTLFVHSSDLNRSAAAPPEILYSADDLLLLRVNMRPRPPFTPWPLYDMDYDYFVYRADPSRPSLQLLRRPHPYLHKSDVGILPRSGGHYTIAALNFTGTPCQYELHVFDSVTSTWRSNILSAPQHYDGDDDGDSPVETHSSNRARVHYHHTTTAITIGGKGGTIGWADLWRGILLCDVLDSPPALRAMPLPSPSLESGGNAAQSRGISFISGKDCRLNFVHMEITGERFTEMDDETGWPSVRVDDWVLTTWSNKAMGSALEDWHKESMVRASSIAIDPAISRVLEDAGLLRDSEATTAERRGLQNLSMYQPSPCVNGEDAVYLVAREKFGHPKAWILAVDMKNGGTLRSAAYFGIREYSGVHVIYCPSRISKYMNPAKYGDVKDAEDSHEDGAVKLIRLT